MSKKLSMAVAGAVLAMAASSANAGIIIPAGDWTVDISGNVNAFYTNTNVDMKDRFYDSVGSLYSSVDPLSGSEDRAQVIQTGLLPSAIGIGAKTRQNDLDIAFQFTFFVGADSGCVGSSAVGGFNGGGNALTGGCQMGAAGANTLNVRQAYMTFGDKSWGTIKLGRDLGIFGSDAILSDMTLLGVGNGAGAGGSSTLGRIGTGYMYADWVGQISYASPNWNGFSFNLGVREPWTNGSSGVDGEMRNNLGFEGKASYEWAGDVSGKAWAGYITQKHEWGNGYSSDSDGYRTDAWEIGAKASVAGFTGVGYYYEGDGISGPAGALDGLMFLSGKETDDDGWYLQGTYALPGIGTKLGVSYGESNSDDDKGGLRYSSENNSWTVGIYHPLTKSLNLVAEYNDQEMDYKEVHRWSGESMKSTVDRRTISLGAIMFF